jgi:exopolysaccharide biosynthesis WecB/TagA/CpsF family protein
MHIEHPVDRAAASATWREAGAPRWPRKHPVLGIGISAATYDEAVAAILAAARQGRRAIVNAAAVHAVVTAARDPTLRKQLNSFDLVVPDGQPVRWALNLLHRQRLPERVYGPELMLRLCAAARPHGLGVYLYGSTPAVLERLVENLTRRFPGLRIAGWEAPPFRPLRPEEDAQVVERIRRSGARLVFIGLGCPRQDAFAFAHRDALDAVQICVGAAFDFHAGTKPMAPPWMQRHGLEWLFRLAQEPRRLWRRYLVTNMLFVGLLARQVVTAAWRRCRWSLPRCRASRSSARSGT